MIEQRTDAWLAQRKGLFTGSEIHNLFHNGRGKGNMFGQTALTYIKAKAIEELTGHRQSVRTFAMQHGIDHEPIAIGLYEMAKNTIVKECGFFTYGNMMGGSPDGLVDDGIIEVKCPINPVIHMDYVMMEDLYVMEKKYYLQVQCNMLCADVGWCDFVTYSPYTYPYNLAIHRIERDEHVLNEMIERVDAAGEIKGEIMDAIKGAITYPETRDVERMLSLKEFRDER